MSTRLLQTVLQGRPSVVKSVGGGGGSLGGKRRKVAAGSASLLGSGGGGEGVASALAGVGAEPRETSTFLTKNSINERRKRVERRKIAKIAE